MTQVKFYESVDDSLLKFAVIIAKSAGKWVLCKHKERTTYEVPGGHREEGEIIEETARRELYEETGATEYTLKPISVYSVIKDSGQETFGMLYYAEVTSFEEKLHSEIERIVFDRRITGKLDISGHSAEVDSESERKRDNISMIHWDCEDIQAQL